MKSNNTEKKTLQRIAHHLDCVVIIGDQGLTAGVIAETQRALDDHELIKIRIASSERADRESTGAQLAVSCKAEVIQRIGKVMVLFKPNPRPNLKLSNLHRYGGGS